MNIFEDYINRDRPFDMVVTLIAENGSVRVHGNWSIYEYKTVRGARIALTRRGYTLYKKYGEE